MSSAVKAVGAAIGVLGLASYLAKRRWDSMDCDYTTFTSKLNPQYFGNRIIWITGASTGIGRALSYYMSSLNVGVKLVLTARRDQLLEQIKNELTAKYEIKNEDIYTLPMDLNTNNKNYLLTKYQTILQYFNVQSIDILVNNAGFSMRSYLIDFDEQDSIDMIQTNLMTPILLTKIVLTDMIKSDDQFGHIVNISSASARLYPPTRSTYTATKVGMLGFTYSMSEEVKVYDNINFTVIVPGLVQSDVDINARGKYGKGHAKRDGGIQNGQDTKRCAEIICTAVSNKILESWPADQPVLKLIYKCYLATPSKYDGREAIGEMLKEAAGYLPSKL